mgnify:CR=1 FL=1
MLFASSIVMTPSRPTFSIASARSSPISLSLFAETVATWRMSAVATTGREALSRALTTAAAPSLICEALPERDDAGLPGDDCLSSGSCSIVGDGNWQAARTAYVETYYNGEDPFPAIETRFDFYQAEIAASGQIGGSAPDDGGLIGGLLDTVDTVVDGLTGQMCAPQASTDTKRRLMVIAALDCTNVDVAAGVSAPVTKYFEAFALGPARDGTLNVEITACLGNGCMDDGRGNLDTDIRDVVRLVE